MEKEKNMLQDKFSAGEYLAPRVKVTRLRSRVLCQSQLKSMNVYGTEQTDEDGGDFE